MRIFGVGLKRENRPPISERICARGQALLQNQRFLWSPERVATKSKTGTASPVGMLFPNAAPLPLSDPRIAAMAQTLGLISVTGSALVNLPRFPSQLLESLFEGLILWLVLWFIVKRIAKSNGTLIAAYLTGYGVIRFVIEYFREPDIGIGFPLAFGDPKGPTYLLTSFLNFSTGQILC